MSFHGVPRRTLDLGDPYHCVCHKTARLLADGWGWSAGSGWSPSSRASARPSGSSPIPRHTLVALAKAGVGRVDVVCPGFVADCLETLEEIGMEGSETFLHAGGKATTPFPASTSTDAVDGRR